MNTAIPAETLSTQRASVEAKLCDLRLLFSTQLDDCVREGLDALPKSLHNITLREFLLLESFVSALKVVMDSNDVPSNSSPTKSSKKPRLVIENRVSTIVNDNTRRVTRSMTRSSSIAAVADNQSSLIPSTPRLHPLLPETPAILRKAIKLAKETDHHTTADDEFRRPVRITRSSIRVVRNENNNPNVFKQPTVPKKPTRQSNVKRRKNEEEEGNVVELDSTVVSLELSNGKVLDVDLSQSPKSMFKGLGSDAVKEVKSKMKTYAAQLRAFFKKLNF